MMLESLLLTALFALTAVAFIGVLNARGVGRTSVAAVLALFCLGAALWQTTLYRAVRAAGFTPALIAGMDPAHSALRGATDGNESDGPQSAGGAGGAHGEGDAADVATLGALVEAARTLYDSLEGEDPSRARSLNDSEYQAFERRAEEYLSTARLLRERAARLSSAPPSTPWEETAELLNVSLQALTAASRDLRAFFRASGRDEEERLQTTFRKGLDAAESPLRRAETGVSSLSEVEGREP